MKDEATFEIKNPDLYVEEEAFHHDEQIRVFFDFDAKIEADANIRLESITGALAKMPIARRLNHIAACLNAWEMDFEKLEPQHRTIAKKYFSELSEKFS